MAWVVSRAGGRRDRFVIAGLPRRCDACPRYREGHRAMRMGPGSYRCTMIGRNEDAPIAMRGQGRKERPDDVAVNFFEGLYFGADIAFMGCFIRGFHMN